ncbi:hypothetical protein DFA_11093 [Cavenderia fasciculata]|uniref:Uncharacterized protein n=1 Tax=Cavenderia fasciculata TaxID=261658 RepID=F4QES1_CACFS|nr:uncharacterized protein DFA_11093 [Cavenderia fasciculata]EGG13332.1 hypothetical protein DFA_11093 [Cavenderia fasciculata]|eukprot:XP_004350036.1 hypothetical protein DFA_11093 [Cavenderia fasciculata]
MDNRTKSEIETKAKDIFGLGDKDNKEGGKGIGGIGGGHDSKTHGNIGDKKQSGGSMAKHCEEDVRGGTSGIKDDIANPNPEGKQNMM